MIRTLSSSAEAVSSLQAFCASMSQRYHQLCRVGDAVQTRKRKEAPPPKYRWLDEATDEQIRQYWERGKSKGWIAHRLGIAHSTVRRRLSA